MIPATKSLWNADLASMAEPNAYRTIVQRVSERKESLGDYPHATEMLAQAGQLAGDRLIRVQQNMSRLSTESDLIHLLLAVPFAIRQLVLSLAPNPVTTQELASLMRNVVNPWQQQVQEQERTLELLSDAFWGRRLNDAEKQLEMSRTNSQTLSITLSTCELQECQVLQLLSNQLRDQKFDLQCLLSLLTILIGELSK